MKSTTSQIKIRIYVSGQIVVIRWYDRNPYGCKSHYYCADYL